MQAGHEPLLRQNILRDKRKEDSGICSFFKNLHTHHVEHHGMKQDTEDVEEVKRLTKSIDDSKRKLEELSKRGNAGQIQIARSLRKEIQATTERRERAIRDAEHRKEGYVYTLDSGYLYTFTADDPSGHDASKNSFVNLSDEEKAKWKRYRRLLNKRYNNLYSKTYDDDEAILRKAAEDYAELKKDPIVRRHSAFQRCVQVKQAKQEKFFTPLKIKCCYWLWPPVIGMCCYIFQITMLHVATHYYINYMDVWQEAINGTNFTELERQAEAHHQLDLKFNLQRIEDGQLWDSMDNVIRHRLAETGKTQLFALPIGVMDAIAFVPGMMYVSLFVLFLKPGHDVNIEIFTKTCFVGSAMAFSKGILDAITVMPDSSGWKNCQKRLKPQGVEALRDSQRFALWKNLVPTVNDLAKVIAQEILGLKTESGRIHARYCADMLVSGHTYIATVCSLGVFKMVSAYLTAYYFKRDGDNLKWYVVKYLVGLLCVVCVCVDVASIAATKFHYTVDIIVALVMVVLLWDSAHLETAVAIWVSGYRWRMVLKDDQKQCLKHTSGDTMSTICPPLQWFYTKSSNLCHRVVNRMTCGYIGLKYQDGEVKIGQRGFMKKRVDMPSGVFNFLNRRLSDKDREELAEERRYADPNDRQTAYTLEEYIRKFKESAHYEEQLMELWMDAPERPAPLVICDSSSRKMIDLIKLRKEREVFARPW